MSHVTKRLAARLPFVAPSTLSSFPPKESFKPVKTRAFNSTRSICAQNWPFIHFSSPDLIRQACTHPSFESLFRQHYPSKPEPATNAQLAAVGNSLMGLFAAEYVSAKYPYLPTRVTKAAVTAYVGPLTCDSVAKEMGATPLLRWHRTAGTETAPPTLHSDALASIPRSLTGLIYKERSLTAAREFVHSYFLSRQVDLRGMLKFYNPKKSLLEMVRKYQREPPKSRLLTETGRFSNSPVFIVGIFSGSDKLGEGFGASLRMAEFRAAEDALHRLYLTQTPPDQLQLPSSTFPSYGDVYQPGQEGEHIAPAIVSSDILYSSSDKSGLRVERS